MDDETQRGGHISDPDPLPVIAGGMDRSNALKLAEETVQRLMAPPLKANGYVVDGHRLASLPERTAAILKIAAFLMADQDNTEP